MRLEEARALKGCTSGALRGAKPSKTGRRVRAATRGGGGEETKQRQGSLAGREGA